MRMQFKVLIFLSCILIVLGQTRVDTQCARHLGCTCDGTLVNCVRKSLKNIPKVSDTTRIFDLRLNSIDKIQYGIFKNLKDLKQLYLNFNKLIILEDNAFNGLSNLQDLYLYNNNIERISAKAFAGLVKLKNLYLDRNKLVTIEAGTFVDLIMLKTLHLFSNKLTGLKREAFDSNVDLQTLRLDGNYLNCNCDLMWLKELFENYTKLSDSHTERALNGICYTPVNLLNRKIISLNEEEFNCVKELKFIELPEDQVVDEGKNVVLKCRTSDLINSRIKWFKNDHDLVFNDSHRIELTQEGDLQIQNVRIDDEGFYVCGVSRYVTDEDIYAQVELVVQVAPFILQTPEDVTIIEGSSAQFQCMASGKPKAIINWYKGDTKIEENSTYILSRDNQILKIKNVKVNVHNGTYTCLAKNSAGVARAQCELRIQKSVAPIFIRPTQNISIYEDHSISLDCQAHAQPQAQVFWYKNGQRLVTDSRVFFDSQGLLVISEVKVFDSGEYLCKASNVAGVARHMFTLTVKDLTNQILIPNSILDDVVNSAKGDVNRGVELTQKYLQDRRKPRTSGDLLALLRYPKEDVLKYAISEEVYERALELIFKYSEKLKYNLSKSGEEFNLDEVLTHRQMQRIADLTGCARHKRKVNCSLRCLKYRTLDGTCNNLVNAHWGASNTPLRRLLPAEYENGFSTPKGWTHTRLVNNYRLPSARLISTKILSTSKVTEDSTYTHMLMQWGQFFDHDLGHTAMASSLNRFSNGIACRESCSNEQPCFSIEIPQNDTRVRDRGRCMEFVRSSAMCGTAETSLLTHQTLKREQINQITSFIDASNVYGSTDQDAFDLRDRLSNSGLLKTHVNSMHPKGLLPFNLDSPMDCHKDNTSQIGCFLAGDFRANEQLALLAMHNLWVRQHNRLALALKRLNPEWTNEKLYQETRKIVGAQMQHITYAHWLPHILGNIGMSQLGTYAGYNASVDASLSNEFTTAAFRFGHALIQPFTFRLNSSYAPVSEGHLLLRDSFFGVEKYFNEGGMDPILRGLYATPAKLKMPREIMNSELTEQLFHITRSVSQDLAALNIQRGRDHGLPGYIAYRKMCDPSLDINSFEDLKNVISNKQVRDILRGLYGDVRNIDLWPGGILEDVLPNSKLGPLFMCLVVRQMKALRDGDRFWYENDGVFSASQLIEIKKTSLAKIICENADDIQIIQRDVFKNHNSNNNNNNNKMIKCDQIEDVSLEPWKKCCQESDFNDDTNCDGLSHKNKQQNLNK